MTTKSWITQYREKRDMSQRALAEAVAAAMLSSPISRKNTKKPKSFAYLKKRISELESGYGVPTPDEIDALSRTFDLTAERILTYVRNPGGRTAVSLFDRLLESSSKAVLLACYSGNPRIPSDPEVVERVRACLRKNLSLGMCIPYPNAPVSGPGALALSAYYQRVRARVIETRELLCKGLPESVRRDNLAIYEPRPVGEKQMGALFPPYFSRYGLLAEEIPGSPASLKMTLFLWVETAETRSMQLIGGMDDPAAQMQIEDWRGYFYELLNHWADHKTLPIRSLEHWARITEAKHCQ
jgi:transcriptional regulator with XRE-family HTH domain